MTRWYPLAESDDEFLDRARFRLDHEVVLPAPADRVWQALTADDALVSWARGITGAEWTSPRPFGVGTTRTVTVGRGVAALRERFYRWETGHRMTFTATAASRPGIRRFAEDLVLTPDSASTRLRWIFAVDAQPWLAPLLNLTRPALARITAGWAAGVTGARPERS
ncbi:SRPBCC family protein [Actinophytocola sediminis]